MRLICPLVAGRWDPAGGSCAYRSTRQKNLGRTCVRPFAAGAVRAPIWLLADAELVDDGAVAVLIRLLQVVEKAAAAADQLEETAAAVMLLRMGLEVLGQAGAPIRQNRHPHLPRPPT